MLPSILAKQLEKGIGDYIETTFPMTNAPFKGSVHNMLETKDSVYHEPYVSVRLPFRVAETMSSCFEAIHPAYLPYVHQQTAFNRLTGDDGRSTLIATGTGSGRTECFILDGNNVLVDACVGSGKTTAIQQLCLAFPTSKRILYLTYNKLLKIDAKEKIKGKNITVTNYHGYAFMCLARMGIKAGVSDLIQVFLSTKPKGELHG